MPESVSQTLSSIGASAAFATHFTIAADPRLHVEGVGEIVLPVSIHTAHRLCAVARPAHHGYKDQTRLDPKVRDTWEIPAGQLRFDAPQWSTALDGALKRIARDLGLPSGARLDAQLHNLLVYAPGQFFATHQDSEKSDGMLATLVVTLPSRFSGGEFVVSHQGQTLSARGAVKGLGMVAFYADCLHEVRSVKEGYRVVLTYNLIARDGVPVEQVSARDVAALAEAVRAFWRTPAAPRWQGDPRTDPPDRLVYLLDHEYTQSSLSWHRLKGADAARASALRQVAQRLDAEIFLTLADVHETWTAEDDDQGFDDRWDDEEGEDTAGDAVDPALGELIESEIELRHWIGADGARLGLETSGVSDAELCFTRASSDCEPFESEYEGYTGNAGSTLDRWYHRAAVVMWPRERSFVIRARQSPRWAIEQIAARLEAGDAAQAAQWAQALQAFWNGAVSRSNDDALLAATLAVCAGLDDAPTAAVLLAPFSLEQLAPDMAPRLSRLLERHGLAWCVECLRQWVKPYRSGEQQLTWLAQALPALVHAWSTAAGVGGIGLAAALVKERWDWLQKRIGQIEERTRGATVQAQAAMGPALLALIRASHDTRDPQLRQQIISALLSGELPVQAPLAVLHAAGADADGIGLACVHAHCEQTLSARLARPVRAADDWSIVPPDGYARLEELGEFLARFLSSPAQRRLEWPLAEARRQLIHQFIDRHELPVKHETRRSGRPYTLVLEKMPALFEREAAEREQWAGELAWLRQRAKLKG